MRVIEKTVYSFDELSGEAKETAINNYRDDNQDFFWSGEVEDTLNKFCDIFSIDWRRIDYQEPYRNDYKINLDENILELSGLRLAKYIWNNFNSYLYKGKYYQVNSDKKLIHKRVKSEVLSNGKIFNAYYSKIQKDNCCVLTGVCYDDDILRPIYEFLDKPSNIDFETLLNDCIISLCRSVSSEIDWRNEDEQIIEEILANEYEFNEDGTRY